MSDKKNNEALDTLQFKIPKVQTSSSDKTKVYRLNDINNAQRTSRPAGTAKQAGTSKNTGAAKPRRTSGTASGQSDSVKRTSNTTNRTAANYGNPVQAQHSADRRYTGVKNGSQAAAKTAKRPGNKAPKIIGGLILVILTLFVVYCGACFSYIGKISDIEDDDIYLNNEQNMLYSSDVLNILVIGTDARSTDTRGLSDSMILLSVNKKNHKLQMTSFMRDIFLPIDGYDYDKLNSAYAYGGAPLLKDTIEDNFLIRIDGCVTVNFQSVAYAVDAVGGVKITLSESEAQAVNDILFSEVNEIMGDDPEDDFLPGEGTYKLNGKQALSYSRIRYVGDADFERTQRQRTVITQMLSGLKHTNPFTANKYINKALPYISTDMDKKQLFTLCLRAPFLLAGYETEQLRVPCADSWWYSETEDGMSIIETDRSMNVEMLKEKIYLAG